MTYARTQVKIAMMYNAGVPEKAGEHIAHFSTRNGYGELTFDPMELIEKHVGRYTRGKHKGELRGALEVLYASRGGWKKDGPGYMNGGVVRPDQVLGMKITGWSGKVYLAYGRAF